MSWTYQPSQRHSAGSQSAAATVTPNRRSTNDADRWRHASRRSSCRPSSSLEKGKEFQEITDESFPGKWQVVFFWPMDFTFICPTEIAEFGRRNADFPDRDAQVLGVQHRHPLRAPGLAQEPRRPEEPAVPDARRHQARARRARSASSTRRTAWRCARRSSSIPRASSAHVERQRPLGRPQRATRCCACSTRCRPTSSAPATGRRAKPTLEVA